MKHLISLSGGAASFVTGHLVVEKHGIEKVIFGFCDTLIEDEDLYKFVVLGVAALLQYEISPLLRTMIETTPPVFEPEKRVPHLVALSKLAMHEMPCLVWLMDGRDPWSVFKDMKYQGNTRTAHCTTELKGKMFARFVSKWFRKQDCVIYFGFDWSEAHRLETARYNWMPYQCEAPLVEPPYLSRQQVYQVVDDYDLDLPRLYGMEFSHNNCGGFCVKAGQGHYANLLKKLPLVYAYHEAKQQQLMIEVPNVRPFLRITINKKLTYVTLREFRLHIESGGAYLMETGGCNCFSDTEANGVAEMLKETEYVTNADGWKRIAFV